MPSARTAPPETPVTFSRPLDCIRAATRDGVVSITFSRPPVNAVDMRAMDEIRAAFTEITEHTDVRAVIFTSAGAKPFCAGADLKAFAGEQDLGFANRIDEGRIARETFSAIRNCPVPVIAAVNGAAVGAGLALAASCDIIIADRTARFGTTEINVGLLGAVSYLRRLAGEYRARELFFTGDLISAEELLRRGTIAQITEPAELQQVCADLAARIAAKSPIAMRLAKDSINRTEALSLEDAYHIEVDYTARLRQFNDSREAAAAYMQKREPNWTLT